MTSKKMTSVAAGAAIISAGTLVSRLLGLVRENLLYNTFPDRWVTDAYLSAFLVPDLLYYLLAGGALSAAFIPVFSSFLAKNQDNDAHKTGSSIANLMLLTIAAGVVLELIFAPALVRLVAPGYELGSTKFNLTVILTREMCAMVLFTALSGLLTGMLNSYHQFLAPTIVWNTYSLGIIFGISVLSKLKWHGTPLGIHGAALGVLVGALSMVVIQLPVVIKYGFRYSPLIDLAHAGVRKVLKLFAPVMLGLSLSQINLLAIPLVIGSILADGAVTDIRAANRLVLLPLGLFAVAISTAAFPTLAQQVAMGENSAFRDTISRSIRVILLLTIPSIVGLIILAEPITSLIYSGKGYGLTDIQATSFALALFSWGLLGMSTVQLVNRAFYSLHDTVTPVIVGVLMVVANIALSLYLIRSTSLNYGGIALSFSITTTLSTLALFDILRRRLCGIGGHAILKTLVKVSLASTVMGGVIFLIALWLTPTAMAGGITERLVPVFPFHWPVPDLAAPVRGGFFVARSSLLLQIGASGIAGIAVYVLFLKLLRVEELTTVTSRLIGKFRRRPAAVS